MANRYFYQFCHSFEQSLVKLMGWFQVLTKQTQASVTEQGILFTAVPIGALGNSISVEFIDPAANNEPLSVAVVGNKINVTLATDGSGDITSTQAEIRIAVNAHAPAALLVTASGGDGTTATAAAEFDLVGGIDFSYEGDTKGFSIEYVSAGKYKISLADKYNALLGFSAISENSDPTDILVYSLDNVDVLDKSLELIVNEENSGFGLFDLDSDYKVYLELTLRNSQK